MTIENSLERIASAVEALVKNQNPLAHQIGSTPISQIGNAITPLAGNGTIEPVKRGPGRPPKNPLPATPEPDPIGAETPQDPDDFLSDGAAPAQHTYSRDEVRAALVGYGKKVQNQEKARALLKQVGGVDTLHALKDDKFADVIDACNA